MTALDAHATEAEFQAAVVGLARLLGWRVAHFRPARTEAGWRTAVAADGAECYVLRPIDWPDIERVLKTRVPS